MRLLSYQSLHAAYEGDDDDESGDEEDPDDDETGIEEDDESGIEEDSQQEDDESGDEDICEEDSLFVKIIQKWCQDDEGDSVLYTETGKDRYPYFKLYKMIARTVHNHIPSKEIENELFTPFRVETAAKTKKEALKGMKKEDIYIDIDSIPDYSQAR